MKIDGYLSERRSTPKMDFSRKDNVLPTTSTLPTEAPSTQPPNTATPPTKCSSPPFSRIAVITKPALLRRQRAPRSPYAAAASVKSMPARIRGSSVDDGDSQGSCAVHSQTDAAERGVSMLSQVLMRPAALSTFKAGNTQRLAEYSVAPCAPTTLSTFDPCSNPAHRRWAIEQAISTGEIGPAQIYKRVCIEGLLYDLPWPLYMLTVCVPKVRKERVQRLLTDWIDVQQDVSIPEGGRDLGTDRFISTEILSSENMSTSYFSTSESGDPYGATWLMTRLRSLWAVSVNSARECMGCCAKVQQIIEDLVVHAEDWSPSQKSSVPPHPPVDKYSPSQCTRVTCTSEICESENASFRNWASVAQRHRITNPLTPPPRL